MDDFASAAMFRLIRAGIARQGLSIMGAEDRPGAHAPLTTKRDVLEQIEASGGSIALLRIGEAVGDMPKDATLVALGAARTPADLINRWQRLERFVHSRHRIEISDEADNRLVLRHVSRKPGTAPKRNEHLLVYGVLLGLLTWIGTSGLRARLGQDEESYREGEWRRAPSTVDLEACEIAWSGTGAERDLAPQKGDVVEAVRGQISTDPALKWTLSTAAQALGISGRSLQRRLKDEGSRFSLLLRDVRATAAAEMLQDTDSPLSQIGFLCGYSDQSHFTRSFKESVGLGPRQFRRDFARPVE